jgi:CheY-specific phosphatase CheX
MSKLASPLFLSSFTTAFQAAFEVQLSCALEGDWTDLGQVKSPDAVVSASLTFQSSKIHGTFAILLPEVTFLMMLEKMIGEKQDAVSADNIDAAAELANIVYASARKKINSLGNDFQPALPVVTFGQKIQVHHPPGSDVSVFTCKSEIGSFHAEISLKAA